MPWVTRRKWELDLANLRYELGKARVDILTLERQRDRLLAEVAKLRDTMAGLSVVTARTGAGH